MKISLLLWIFISSSSFNFISCLENEEMPSFIMNTTNDDAIEPRASHPHLKHKLNKIFNPTKEYCFKIPKGDTIPEILNNKNFDRLVVYFYNVKNNNNEEFNTKIMYVPGVTKQNMIPDLPVDKEDLILDSGRLQINDIFSAANSYVTNSKNKQNHFKNSAPVTEYNEDWNIKKPVNDLDNKWENEMSNYFNDFLYPHGKEHLDVTEAPDVPISDSENENVKSNSEIDLLTSNTNAFQNPLDQLQNWHLNEDKESSMANPYNTDNSETKDTESNQYNTDVNDIENSLGKRVFQKQILLKLLLKNGITIDANGNLRDPKGRVFNLNDIYFIPIIERNKNRQPISYSLNSIGIVLKRNQRIVSIIKIRNKILIGTDIGPSKNAILNYPPKRPAVEDMPVKSDNLFGSETFPLQHGMRNNVPGLSNIKHFTRPRYTNKQPCRTLTCKLEQQAMQGVAIAPRIIGGSAAIASGFPIRNRGRSGLII